MRTTVAVAVCTYHRNDPLAVLLDAVLVSAAKVQERAAVGVVIVDDSSTGRARQVVDRFAGRFELGLAYLRSAGGNISRARNMAIQAAAEVATWTAMTDDDCQPSSDWIDALLEVQTRAGADAVTGPLVRRPPPAAPSWLRDEPFLELGLDLPEDAAAVGTAATHNSMVSSQWLTNHRGIRFEPSLGTIGGEDMVFYRTAAAAGLRIHFARRAVVYEDLPSERGTLAYQLRAFYWHGNSSFVTSAQSGVGRVRLLLHAANNLRRALARPAGRALSGRSPQLRYSTACALHSVGMMVGAAGVRVRHR